MNVIIKAAQFARRAHSGQRRKYIDQPYVEHCMRVAGRVSMIDKVDPAVVAAAWLHDVVEDCNVDAEELTREFGNVVCSLVLELTNPSKKFPELPRAEKKAMDREHLSRVSYWAKVIKLIDRIDNLQGMRPAPHDFRELYAGESYALAYAIADPDKIISPLVLECYQAADELMAA